MGRDIPLSRTEMRDTLRYRILVYLRDHGECSISEISRNLPGLISNIRDRLWFAKTKGHVIDQNKRIVTGYGQPIIAHFYKITEEGKKWLEIGAPQLT